MALEDIINERLERLHEIPDKFVSEMQAIQQSLYEETLGFIAELERNKAGQIILNEANLAQIEIISRNLNNEMFTGRYAETVRAFVAEFETQALLTTEMFKELGFNLKEREIFLSIIERAQADVLALLNADAIQVNFLTPFKEILNNSIISEQTFKETVKSVKLFMLGDAERLGHLQRYASTFSRDLFNISDRRYSDVLAKEFDVQWFKYSGGKVKDTRVFCVDRFGKIFHRTEFEDWGMGKNIGRAGVNWQGKNPQTNKDNIFFVLGGHNCIHTAIPVAESAVPKSVKNRIK